MDDSTSLEESSLELTSIFSVEDFKTLAIANGRAVEAIKGLEFQGKTRGDQ